MQFEGPQLETLTHRLAECPEEFLLPPRVGATGTLHVDALVADLFRDMNVPLPAPLHQRQDRPFLTLAAIATWLLHDDWFLARPELASGMHALFAQGIASMATLMKGEAVITDPDRREEFVRVCLGYMNLRPQGESMAQAADRLTTLDSVERARIMRDTQAAESRARQVREMMAKRAAEEAAAKATRE